MKSTDTPNGTHPDFLGFVDHVSAEGISGWVVDRTQPGRPIEVIAQANGRIIGTTVTSRPREDISLMYEGAEKSGFLIPISSRLLKAGPLPVQVTVGGSTHTLQAVPELGRKPTITLELSRDAADGLRTQDRVLAALAHNVPALVALNHDPEIRAKVDAGLANVILVNGARGTASELFRTYEAAAALRRIGYLPLVYEVDDLPYLPVENLLLCVFVRVALSPTVEAFVRKLKKAKVPIATDFDDLVFRPSLMHKIDGVRFLNATERATYAEGMLQYRAMLECSDLCITTTASLAEHAKTYCRKTAVVHNHPLHAARKAAAEPKPAKNDAFVVGYYSGTLTHQADLRQCSQAIAVFLKRYSDAVLRIVGKVDLTEFPELAKLSSQIEQQPLMTYAQMIGDIARCDVTIAPLEVGNEFCEAKSELKYFDAALSAVPVIASPTQPFAQVIRHGANGFLAKNVQEWLATLEACYLDRTLTARCGAAALEDVSAHYTESTQEEQYLQALRALGVPMPQDWTAMPVPPQKAAKPGRVAPRTRLKKLAVLLPDVLPGSGGHNKALTFCREYVRRGGEVEVCFISDKPDHELQAIISRYYFEDCGQVRAYRGMPPACDVAVATSWPTAYEVARWNGEMDKHYFVQDFEPLFSPMSSDYAQAQHSYRLGLNLVSFGQWNANKLQRELGLASRVVGFPVDREIYFPRSPKREKTVLFYARPSQPRRLYELGLAAIQKVRPYVPGWQFVFFGEDVAVDGMAGVSCAGKMTDLKELAKLYSRASLGIAFSSTNPSLVPFEMLSCGLPVLDVDLGQDRSDFEGCKAMVLADPTPDALAKKLMRTLTDAAALDKLSAEASAWAGKLPAESTFADEVLKAVGLA